MPLKPVYRAMIRQKTAVVLNMVCLSIAFAVLLVVVKRVMCVISLFFIGEVTLGRG